MHHIAPLLGVLALAGTLPAQEPLAADSRISEVTLYRGTALVIPEHELAHIGRSQVRRLLAGSRRMEA